MQVCCRRRTHALSVTAISSAQLSFTRTTTARSLLLRNASTLSNTRPLQQDAASTARRVRQSLRSHVPDEKLPPWPRRKDPSSWTVILENALPARLRTVQAGGPSPTLGLTPREVASILVQANASHGIDLLTHLGIEKGRWRAVVWLVTHLVDNIWKAPKPPRRSLPGIWNGQASLTELTATRTGTRYQETASFIQAEQESLDGVTATSNPFYKPLMSRENPRADHQLLGQIWRSLGNMIVADAARKPAKENTITPEILEIIALLHHCGFMPQSIYSYTPSDEATSLQQPPTLHLLSSNILTSLSDAAWKAHEKSVVEEARAKGGAYAASRPEIPGSQYNVRIAGLGHEIWLELVLWSCLHGGWILDGASVLGAVARQKDPQRWPILSWREIVTPIVRAGQENSVDWNEVRYLLNSGTVYGNPTLNAEIRKKVRRTVSAEVVAAYADALINIVRVGVGVRGTAPGVIVQLLQTLKRFLETNNLSLGTMSWDSIILRIIESQGVDIEVEPGLAERIIDLSSPFGQEPGSTNSPARNEQWEPQPVYIHDGTAAPLGLTHRILQAYIRVGNLGGALRVLNALQKRTDQDKQRSIEAFFQKTKGLSVDPLNSALHPDPPSGLDFESQYAGIEYPNFFMQLPVTVLAPLLDLIVDAGALDFGTWLLRAQDVDGPVIPESLYADDVMAPALIRFAAAAQDKVLLRKIIDLESAKARGADRGKRSTRFSGQVLVSFLESQLESRNWEAAEKIMDVLLDTPSVSYTDLVAAMLARAMLRQARHAVFGNSDGQPRPLTRGEYGQAFVMLRRFVRKVYGIQNLPKKPLYSVLAVLASINKAWKSLCESLPPPTASRIKGEVVLSPRSFNTVLEGVVDAYGSVEGRTLLNRFWRPGQSDESILEEDKGGVPRMPAERPGAVHQPSHTRISYIPREDQDPIRVAVRFKPDISTIRIILRKAVEEERKAANWATRQLRSLGLREGDIQEELKRSLRTEKVHDPVSESRAETEEGENEPEARDVDLSRGGETC